MHYLGRRLRIVIACFIVALPVAYYFLARSDNYVQPAVAQSAARSSSGAIGRIEPKDGIVVLSGVPGATVKTIDVKVGDAVASGEVLMTLQDESSKAEEEIAALDLAAAQKLAGSRMSAQNLAVQLASQRLQNANRDLATYRALGPSAVSAKDLARMESLAQEARVALQLEQTKQEIAKTEADSQIQSAQKRLDLAQSKYAAEIRAPGAGTVLAIDKRVGERLDGQAAVQIADLSTMYVVSQVYEGDLLTLEPGMKATVRSATLAQPMTGTVDQVSRLVDTRSRLGEIRIKLDSPDPASRLVGLEVEVVIAR